MKAPEAIIGEFVGSDAGVWDVPTEVALLIVITSLMLGLTAALTACRLGNCSSVSVNVS